MKVTALQSPAKGESGDDRVKGQSNYNTKTKVTNIGSQRTGKSSLISCYGLDLVSRYIYTRDIVVFPAMTGYIVFTHGAIQGTQRPLTVATETCQE